MDVGKVNTLCWEERIQGSGAGLQYNPPKTPPPLRKEMHITKVSLFSICYKAFFFFCGASRQVKLDIFGKRVN